MTLKRTALTFCVESFAVTEMLRWMRLLVRLLLFVASGVVLNGARTATTGVCVSTRKLFRALIPLLVELSMHVIFRVWLPWPSAVATRSVEVAFRVLTLETSAVLSTNKVQFAKRKRLSVKLKRAVGVVVAM